MGAFSKYSTPNVARVVFSESGQTQVVVQDGQRGAQPQSLRQGTQKFVLPNPAYVFETLTPNAHLYLPREDKKDLYLIQQYLVLQIYFFPGLSWSIELTVSDLNKVRLNRPRPRGG